MGLGQYLARVVDKPYDNNTLWGQLLQKSRDQLHYADHLSDIADKVGQPAGLAEKHVSGFISCMIS